MKTSELYSPHDLLPAPIPASVSPPLDYFYHNIAKHLIKDTVRIMSNGLPIDLTRVEQLEEELDKIITGVKVTLANNDYVKQYLEKAYSKQIQAYKAEQAAKLKLPSNFLVPFDHKKPEHRSYFMYLYAQQQGITQPTTLLPTGIPKWSANDVKKLSTSRPILQRLLAGTLIPPETLPAMTLLSEHKAEIKNKSYHDNIASPSIPYPEFNPASSLQKKELFAMLGYTSEAVSKTTGEESWDRDQIERLFKETSDPILKELLQALIDHSFSAIVRSNFIEAFYRYTVDGRLHGQYKLFGAKTFRYTSSNPNMLNTPSSKSIFSKPIKRCFVAPPGYIIATADYSALENRVIANLANEKTLIEMYANDLDGHCVNSLYYFREEIAEHIPLTGDLTTDAELYASKLDEIPALKAIRQKGKAPSFGLQYGAYPPKIASSIKCSISEAETIFNRYHNELYPSVTAFRENYVLPTALENGKLHLGLGCYIKTDNPSRDIRTITNASSQFWSILTLLTINKMHQRIDAAGLQDDIQCISTIYDAIYFICKADPHTIKWLNDNLIEVMLTPYLEGEVCHNLANLDVGPDWASVVTLPNNASISQIQEVLDATTTDTV